MPGLYNNETGLHEEACWMRSGDWYQDEDGALYILPDPTYGISENEGPDGEVMDQINALQRAGFRNQQEDLEELGLTRVPHSNKCFDPEIGYYAG